MYGICVTYPKVVRCRLRSVAAASDKNEVAATGTSAKAGQLGRKPPNDGFGGSGSGAAGASRPRSRRARRGSDVESGGEGKEVQVGGRKDNAIKIDPTSCSHVVADEDACLSSSSVVVPSLALLRMSKP